MTATSPLPAPGEAVQAARDGEPGEPAVEQALDRVKEPVAAALISPASPLARLPMEVDVAIPVRDFRVRNLLAIAPGQIIETQWVNGEDMPLAAGEVQLAWTEFEVIETLLAVRVTRLV